MGCLGRHPGNGGIYDVRSRLMMEIREYIENRQYPPAEAAR